MIIVISLFCNLEYVVMCVHVLISEDIFIIVIVIVVVVLSM